MEALPDELEDKYLDYEEDRSNDDEDEDPEVDELSVRDDDDIVEG